MTKEIILQDLAAALEKVSVAGRALETARATAEKNGAHELADALQILQRPHTAVVRSIFALFESENGSLTPSDAIVRALGTDGH